MCHMVLQNWFKFWNAKKTQKKIWDKCTASRPNSIMVWQTAWEIWTLVFNKTEDRSWTGWGGSRWNELFKQKKTLKNCVHQQTSAAQRLSITTSLCWFFWFLLIVSEWRVCNSASVMVTELWNRWTSVFRAFFTKWSLFASWTLNKHVHNFLHC